MQTVYSYANNDMVVHVFQRAGGEYMLNILQGSGKRPINKYFGDDLEAAQEEFNAIVEEQNRLLEEFVKRYE